VRALFRRVRESLQTHGLFLLDLAGPGRVPSPGVQKSFAEGEGWAVLVEGREDGPAGTLTRQITTFRQSEGDLYRRDQETHHLRLHPPAEVAAWLREAGFAHVETRNAYGPLRLPPGWTAFAAR
jgi:hypothetical protein